MISLFKKQDTRPKIEKLGSLLQSATDKNSNTSAKRRKKYIKNMMDIAAGEKNTHYADMIATASYAAVLTVQKQQNIFKAAQLAGQLFEYSKELTDMTGDETIQDALKEKHPVFEGKNPN